MSDILTHQDAGVMTITFNRLDKKNAITGAMYALLANAIEHAQNTDSVKVVVLQGHETIFTAGNDISDFLHRPRTSNESPAMDFLHNISTCTKPIVESVCGPAVGIGTTMLMHCDLVYAGDNAAFALPFVNLGLCPEAASRRLVPQMMGYHRAAEALLLGEPFMAEAALEVGLVNRVVAPNEANNLANAIAQKLAKKPISALIETKRLMKKNQMGIVQSTMKEELVSFGRMLHEPAAKEAFGAFLEKRKPDFSKIN